MSELYGPETRKAIANFPVSGRGIPVGLVHWLGRIKAAAARVNADLGLLDSDARRAHRGCRRRRGPRRARRPVPHRRLPDRLGHVLEHERQRGHRDARRGGRPSERPREPRSELERRVSLGRAPGGARPRNERAAAGARQAAGLAGRQGERVRGRRQGRTNPPDGCGTRHDGPGVRGLRRADLPRPRPGRGNARPARPDPARRDGDGHGSQHPPGVRRARARAPRERVRA